MVSVLSDARDRLDMVKGHGGSSTWFQEVPRIAVDPRTRSFTLKCVLSRFQSSDSPLEVLFKQFQLRGQSFVLCNQLLVLRLKLLDAVQNATLANLGRLTWA